MVCFVDAFGYVYSSIKTSLTDYMLSTEKIVKAQSYPHAGYSYTVMDLKMVGTRVAIKTNHALFPEPLQKPKPADNQIHGSRSTNSVHNQSCAPVAFRRPSDDPLPLGDL